MLVEIRPLSIKKWHGKEGKESFTRTKKIQALIDSDTMMYQTGLDNMKTDFKDPKTGAEITEVEYYGKLLGQDLNNIASMIEPHPFWDSNMAVVKLENNTVFFNTNIPLDYIKWKICKASKFVANSIADYNEGLYPEATHYIFDEKETVEAKATKIAMKKKAILECSKLTAEKKRQIVLILTDKILKSNSSDFIEVELDSLIEKNAEAVLNILGRDKDSVVLEAIIKECLFKSVLRKKGHKYMYFDSTLGTSMESTIDYLGKPENQELRFKLQEQIKSSK